MDLSSFILPPQPLIHVAAAAVVQETRIYAIPSPVRYRYIRLAVTEVGEREATLTEGGMYNFLVLSELRFIPGEYLCTAAPEMRGYDPTACAKAVIVSPEHGRNPCAKSTDFLFTKDRVVSQQGTTLGLALNMYEVVPCFHPGPLVCNTEQVLVPVAPPVDCLEYNASERLRAT